MKLAQRLRDTLAARRPLPTGHQVVLHLGSQKTGTTAVQSWCREHTAELAAAGVTTRTTQPDIRAALDGWYDVARPGADQRLREFLDDAWRTSRSPGLFYSCESNTGPAFAPDSAELYPRIAENLAGIDRATDGVPRHVQFTVRGYAAFLESAYQQQLKHGKVVRFEELAGRVGSTLSWRGVVEELVRTFGAEHVTVYDYDRDRSGSRPLVGQILADALDRLGARGVEVGEEVSRRTNTRYTQRMADLSLDVLPLLRGSDERVAFHRFVTGALGRHPAPGDVPASFLDDGAVSALDERYAEDLAWVASVVELR
ncbi:hypothetical protein GCM10009718_30970 [Isoptericola halotolerans]|uniref:Sulfotransferase family protein n=1 Tax=Isoptericola halotolerans TaxID=300560 RepID=A0ABX2A6P6_9MICO|nr:hypothetical protein [Isoptericola halotolerans]NOV97565.1 hypothetical protein [Isoptericola halotolerans]